MKNRTQVIEKELKFTAEEFRRLFKKEGYSQIEKRGIPYTDESVKVAEKILNENPAMVTEFNQMQRKADFLIKPSHYVLTTLQKFIKYGENQHYKIDDVVGVYLFNRLKNACIGFMAEVYAIIIMLENFDNAIILTNEEADLKEGVDFMLIDLASKTAFPVHVTAQSAGKNSLNEKEERVRGRNNNFDVPFYYSKKIEDDNSLKRYIKNFLTN